MSGAQTWQGAVAAERAAMLATTPPPPRIAAIIGAVAQAFSVPVRQILSPRRAAPIVRARQAAMHLALELSGHSSIAIGRALGRDHSTVLHGDAVTRMRVDEDPEFAARIAALRTLLTQAPTGDA